MSKSRLQVLPVFTTEARLKRRLRQHFAALGLAKDNAGALRPPTLEKEAIRTIHSHQRNSHLQNNHAFVHDNLPILKRHFASGSDIDVNNIKPVLQQIRKGTWESNLFRLSTLTWSVPVSNGFGRRIRYLVWDKNNGKLIGLIAIGDPVFNLSARDNFIGWNVNERANRLVNIMDAYVLGALPPYNFLLGGKLISCLLRTQEIYDDFARLYGEARGTISGKNKSSRLLAITTSSSLGRSSVYNRLSLDGISYFKHIGFTEGWGHFHISDEIFADLRALLRTTGTQYGDLNRFGHGPNWRFRTARTALRVLGIDEQVLRHGIKREVFICGLATNTVAALREEAKPDFSNLLDISSVAELASIRWIRPRAERCPQYLSWTVDKITPMLYAHVANKAICVDNL